MQKTVGKRFVSKQCIIFEMLLLLKITARLLIARIIVIDLTDEMLELIRSYITDKWADKKENFLSAHESLISMYESKCSMMKMNVNINGNSFTFSPSKHTSFKKLLLRISLRDLPQILNVFM